MEAGSCHFPKAHTVRHPPRESRGPLEKEMKLARVFNESCLLAENEGRNFIRESMLMGGKSPFLDKLEKVIEPLGELPNRAIC